MSSENLPAPVQPQAPMAVAPHGGIQITTLDDLKRIANMVLVSGCAPNGMNKVESICVAIQMGFEIGLQPMQSIQNIAVINGRPSVYGDAAKGLVESSGLCTEFDEYCEGKEGEDSYTAICKVKRLGRTKPITSCFSIADAKQAKLWGKTGPWSQYPKRMLQMRARGFAIRDAFPDVLKGLITAEEARDIIDVTPSSEPVSTPREAPPERDAGVIETTAEVVEPEPEPAEPEPETPPPAEDETPPQEAESAELEF